MKTNKKPKKEDPKSVVQERSAKESSKIVAKTISEIKSHKDITDELISEICEKYGISEKHIRRVAGFDRPSENEKGKKV